MSNGSFSSFSTIARCRASVAQSFSLNDDFAEKRSTNENVTHIPREEVDEN